MRSQPCADLLYEAQPGQTGRWSPLRRWTPWSQSSPSEALKIYDALWTFGRVEGVEPTHNTAERVIRSGGVVAYRQP